jgi:hypothetical protein
MRKISSLVLLLALLCPCMSGLASPPAAPAKGHNASHKTDKLTDVLRARVGEARKGDRTRVIVSLADGANTATTRHTLEGAGAQVRQQLDQLGIIVADAPTAQL